MNQNASDEMRAGYDFSDAVQGKHHRAYSEGTNVVLLEPDVARIFKDSASVNRTLRLLIEIFPGGVEWIVSDRIWREATFEHFASVNIKE